MSRLWEFIQSECPELMSPSDNYRNIIRCIVNEKNRKIIVKELKSFSEILETKILSRSLNKYSKKYETLILSSSANINNEIIDKINRFKESRTFSLGKKKLIILSDIDLLQNSLQLSFRRTLDNYHDCGIILKVSKKQNVEESIFSRCNEESFDKTFFLQFYCRIIDINYLKSTSPTNLDILVFCDNVNFTKQQVVCTIQRKRRERISSSRPVKYTELFFRTFQRKKISKTHRKDVIIESSNNNTKICSLLQNPKLCLIYGYFHNSSHL